MARGARLIAGVDEVGRGPLAGPVTAAAVILDPEAIPEGINDSKKLGVKRRQMLPVRPDHVLIDGNKIPRGLNLPATAVVKGDTRSLSIGAASIVAKIARDAIMEDLAQQFPGYGWESNAGYPTKAHRSALHALGVTPHHRRSFAPVRNILCRDEN